MTNVSINSQRPNYPLKDWSDRTTLPARFLLICVLSCSVVAFSVGRLVRVYVVPDIDFALLEEFSTLQKAQPLGQSPGLPAYDVPTPLAKGGKIVPPTIYTTKNFDTRRSSVIVSQFLQPSSAEGEISPKDEEDVVPAPHNIKLTWNDTDVAHYDKDEEEHLPAGQHLLVDIDGLDASFLNSESRLASAMISLVDNSGLTLLSYHCHGLSPEGVSCAGVLLESHVAFHTWPTEGVITLDLFTCGSTSLLDSMSLIEDMFVIPRSGMNEAPPTILWAYKRRGFNEQSGFIGSRDTFAYPLGIHGMDYKKEVASLETGRGKLARVYDMRSHNSLSMTRQFYLDGVLKSNSLGHAAAHESFVHPAMLTHEAPQRVLILGDQTGASVREVLKHPGVVDVTVVGADQSLTDFSRTHLSEWNDCGGVSCFDDDRVQFIPYSKNPKDWVTSLDGGMFDVILLDFFDMEEEFASEIMENRMSFLTQVSAIQGNDGVAVLNIAGSGRVVESSLKGGQKHQLATLRTEVAGEMTKSGYVDTLMYDATNVDFAGTRHYLVAFKTQEGSRNWNRNQAEIEYELRKRFESTTSVEPSFHLFDSAIMASYAKQTIDLEQTVEGVIKNARSRAFSAIEQSSRSRTVRGNVKNELNSSVSGMDASESCSSDNVNLSQKGLASSSSWTGHVQDS